MPDSNSSPWKQLYLETLKETDSKRLADLAYCAEKAIFFRLAELEGSSDHAGERRELKEACTDLMTLRVEKLGWPNPYL